MPDVAVTIDVTSIVEVSQPAQTIVVVEQTPATVVELISRGPQGIQGDKGDAGDVGPQGSALGFIHTQSTPSATWVVDHTLGKFPGVTVVDSGGDECEGDVQYVSNSQIIVRFCAPFGGKAYLN